MVSQFFFIFEEYTIGIALVSILLIILVNPEKALERINSGKIKIFIYITIAFYYLSVVWNIIKQFIDTY